jgi:tetratricopeptide (TPR) repeat protein
MYKALFPVLAAAFTVTSAALADENTPSIDVSACVNPGPDPARLYSGLGETRAEALLPGPNADQAQRFYRQGLLSIYGFNKPEAINSFVAAAKAAPGAPMPYWGIALAAGPDINTTPSPQCLALAAEAVERAAKLAAMRDTDGSDYPRLREKERKIIQAQRTRYTRNGGAIEVDARGYADEMGKVAAQYPKDHDVATLYASALLNIARWRWWNDGVLTPEASLARSVLKNVLAQEPGHIGANHYFIHATEQSPDPAEALPSAERMGDLAPGAGHIVHMPSHIYRQMGKHAEASEANYRAVAADRAYIDQTPESAQYPLRYLNHNLHFLTMSLLIEGREAESMAAAEALFDNTKKFTGNAYNQLHNQTIVASRDELFLTIPIVAIIRNRAWDSDLKARLEAELPPLISSWNLSVAQAFSDYSSILQLIARDSTEMDRVLAVFDRFWESVAAVPPDLSFDNNSAADIMRLANLDALARATERFDGATRQRLVRRARMRMAEIPVLARDANAVSADGDLPISLLLHAVTIQDGLNYAEPPNWHYPMREALGGALYRAGRFDDAAAVFREGLQKNRGYPRMMFGLIESLRALDRAVPSWLEEGLRKSRRHATVELSMREF